MVFTVIQAGAAHVHHIAGDDAAGPNGCARECRIPVVDFAHGRGGAGQHFGGHRLVAGEVERIKVAAHNGVACAVDVVVAHHQVARGAVYRAAGAQGKGRHATYAVVVGEGAATGTGLCQGLEHIRTIQVLGTGNRVARPGAVGGAGVGHFYKQLLGRHDGVVARGVGNGVVAGRQAAGTEHAAVGSGGRICAAAGNGYGAG